MNAAARRGELMDILRLRGHETVPVLANELGVSERTILRDVEVLSLSEPIYTRAGKYGGGVYIMRSRSPSRAFLTREEYDVLQKIIADNQKFSCCSLCENELLTLRSMVKRLERGGR